MSGATNEVDSNYEQIADDLITSREAQDLLRGKSRRTIYTLCQKGILTAYKLGGTLYLRRSEVLDALLSKKIGKVSQ